MKLLQRKSEKGHCLPIFYHALMIQPNGFDLIRKHGPLKNCSGDPVTWVDAVFPQSYIFLKVKLAAGFHYLVLFAHEVMQFKLLKH